MAGVSFAAASSGPGAIVATLRFNPVPDEDMLPEARKEIAGSMWETIVQNGVDCIFINKLPAQEEFNYTETPLDTVPVLVQQTPCPPPCLPPSCSPANPRLHKPCPPPSHNPATPRLHTPTPAPSSQWASDEAGAGRQNSLAL